MLFSIPRYPYRCLKILNISRTNAPESQRCSLPSTTAAPFPQTVLTAVGCIQYEFKDSTKLKEIEWLKLAKTKKTSEIIHHGEWSGHDFGVLFSLAESEVLAGYRDIVACLLK